MLIRVRVVSFLSGAAVAGAAALYQIRKDIQSSHEFLAQQAREARESLELRVSALEAIVAANLQPSDEPVDTPQAP
eukprot:jgi/Chrzof1/13795/Cz08g12210.t1